MHSSTALPRVHLAFSVEDLRASTAFYRILLEASPVREESGYVRFQTDSPPLLLALNAAASGAAGPQPPTGVEHFGIELSSPAAVAEAAERLRRAGLATRVEREVDCCYAVQDKVWVEDPDRRRWEFFTILRDGNRYAPEGSARTQDALAGGECCAGACAPRPREHAGATGDPA